MKGDLRKRAERLLHTDPEQTPEVDTLDVKRVLHELEVHRVELQMQHEELQNTARELERSRDAYAGLYNSAPVGYLSCDCDGVVLQANRTAAEMLGAANLEGRPFSDFIMPDSQAAWQRHRRALLAGAQRLSVELELKPEAGPPVFVWVECTVQPDGTAQGWSCRAVLIDITARRRAEEARRGSEQFSNAVLDSLPAHIAVIDRRGIIRSVNARWRQFAKENGGSSARSMEEGADYLDVCRRACEKGGEQVEAALNGIQDVLDGRRASFECEYPCRLDDRQLWFLMQVAPVEKSDMVILSHLDITAQKQADHALRESEARYRQLVQTASEGIWQIDAEFRTVEINGRMAELLGCSKEEVVGRPIWEFIPDDEMEDARQRAASRRRGLSETYERKLRRKNGTTLWVLVSSTPLYDAAGKRIGSFGMFTDITARRQAEDELRITHALARSRLEEIEDLYRNAPVGLCVLDTELRFVRINERLAEMNGIPAEDHIGKKVRDILPELADTVEPDMRRVLETGEPRLDVEVVGKTPARPGVERSWLERWLPITDARGRVSGISIVIEETTERKRVEAELRESRARLRGVLDSSPDPIFLKDRNGRLLLANSATFAIIGKPPQECLGRTDAEFYDDADAGRAIMETDRKVMAAGKPQAIEETVPGTEGPRTFLSTKAPVRDSEGRILGLVGVSRDITERMQARMELQRQKTVLQGIFDYSPVLIVMWDATLQRFTLNRKAEEVLGWTTEDANAGNFMESVYPDPDYRAEVEDFMESLEPGWRELKCVTKEGASVPIEWANIRLTDETMVGIGVDLRERKKADLLQRRLAQFPMENPNPVLRVGPGGEFFYANGSAGEWLEKLGWSGGEMLPDCIQDIVRQAIGQNGVVESEVVDPSGRTLWLSAVQPAGEKYVNFYGRDVTERKRIEAQIVELNEQLEQRVRERTAELAESEEKFRSLVEKTRDITCRTDADGVLRYVAPQAALYGFDPAELEGRNFLDLVRPEERERMAAGFQKTMETGEVNPSEFRLYAPDGTMYWFEGRSSVLYDASGKVIGLNSVLREFTAHKKADETALRYRGHLRRLAAQLVKAQDEEQRRIAEGLHDDVAQLLAACSIKLGEAEYAASLEAARPVHDQIDELLDEAVEKIRSLSFELASSTLYRAGFRKALQELCEHMTDRYGIRFGLQWEEPAAEPDDATATVLFRAVRELLFNVVKHARVKEALVCVSMDGDMLEVYVEDRGAGFADPLNSEGRGLGLFGIEERLRDMGGRLAIDSQPGIRTRVSLYVAVGDERTRMEETGVPQKMQ